MNSENFFQNLYNETYDTLVKYVTLKCDNISNVEDIIQNVYLKVYKQIKKKGIDYFKNPTPLLIKFCKNELFDYYNLKNKFNFIFNKGDDDEDIFNKLSSMQNIEEEYIIHDTLDNVWIKIKEKDLITQKIAIFYFLEGLTIKDISKLLKMNINTTKSKLYRLIKELNIQEEGCQK